MTLNDGTDKLHYYFNLKNKHFKMNDDQEKILKSYSENRSDIY